MRDVLYDLKKINFLLFIKIIILQHTSRDTNVITEY